MIRRFQQVTGHLIERMEGQSRYAYSMSDQADLYDLLGWAEHGGYSGAVIRFYDLETGAVFQPFEKQRDVLYSSPAYEEGGFWFLRGDYAGNTVTLYCWRPGAAPESAAVFPLSDVELYNLRVIGSPVHVISQREMFRCYYPVQASFPLQPNETVCMIEHGRVYIEAWIEEGWDAENDCATEDYRFYNMIRTKDLQGNLLSEEVGALNRAADGTWWIS